MDESCKLPGVLIAFEGLAIGERARAIEAVRGLLESHGREVVVSRWMSSALAGDVYQEAAPLFALSPRTLALLAACDIAERMEWEILPALAAGKVVLADRYVYRVAIGMVRDLDPDWLEVLCGAGPLPDAVFSFVESARGETERSGLDLGQLSLYEAGMDVGMTHDLPLSYRFYTERLRDSYQVWADSHSTAVDELPSAECAVARVQGILHLGESDVDPRRRAVLDLLKASRADPDHARQVAWLAGRLFDLTAERHHLGVDDRRLLEYAALLHDITGSELGEHPIRSASHLKESGLLGFSPSELDAMAVLIAIHRALEGQNEVEQWFQALSPDLQQRVNLLGPLFRLADGLDIRRMKTVRNLDATIHDGLFDILLRARNRAKVEIRAAVSRADLFEHVYDLHLAINVDRNGPPQTGTEIARPAGVAARDA